MGLLVLVADPGRRYLPDVARREAGFTELARHEVRTTTALEDRERVEARVWVVGSWPADSGPLPVPPT